MADMTRKTEKVESFQNETRNSPQHSSLQKIYKRAETQSLTVEIKMKVQKGIEEHTSEGKDNERSGTMGKENEERRSRERSFDKEYKSRVQQNESNHSDDGHRNSLDLVSTEREKFHEKRERTGRQSFKTERKSKYDRYRYEDDSRSSRSRSRSPSRSRRNRTPERRRRSYSRYRGGRRSRSRSQCRNRRYGTPDRRSRSRSRRYETPDRSRRTYNRDARRSRSPSRHRRADTPDRSQRSYTHDRDVRRSGSRSRHRRDNTRRSRRSYSRDRSQRSRNSRIDCHSDRYQYSSGDDRIEVNENFSSLQNRDDNSNSATDHLIPQKQEPENYSNNSTIDILRSRIQSSLSNSAGEWRNLAVSSTSQTGNVRDSSDEASSKKLTNVESQISTFIHSILSKKKDDANPELTVKSEELGQRMESDLLEENGSKMLVRYNAAPKSNENNSDESVKWSGGMSIDDSIIQKIVSRDTAYNTIHSNFNNNDQVQFNRINDTRIQKIQNSQLSQDAANKNDQEQFTRTNDPRIQKIQNERLLVQQAANMNDQGQFSRINDPRIQKLQNSRLTTQRDSGQIQPYCSLSPHSSIIQMVPNYNETCFPKPSLSANSPIQGQLQSAQVNFFAPSVLTDPRLVHTFQEPAILDQFNRFDSSDTHTFPSKKNLFSCNGHRASVFYEKKPVPMTYGQYKKQLQLSVTDNKATAVKPTSTSKLISDAKEWNFKIPKKTTKGKAEFPETLTTNKNKNKNVLASETMHEQSNMIEYSDSVNATENEDTKQSTGSIDNQLTDENTMKTLKNLMNPQNLLTLVGLMEVLQRSTKEADTNIVATKKDTDSFSTSTDFELADGPTKMKRKPKNELDRLHEDINNMFIRDGVLNANGRRRTRCQSTTYDNSESPKKDIFIVKKQKTQNTPTARSVSLASIPDYKTPNNPPEAMQVLPSRTSENVPKKIKVKKWKSSKAIEDADWTLKTFQQPSQRPSHLLTKKVSVMKKPTTKNNNSENHSLRKVLECQICDKPPGVSLTSHYVNFHPDREVLNCRISPEAAKYLRSSGQINKCEEVRPGFTTLYKQFCYFCNVYKAYSKMGWICHMSRHTGYYQHKCNDCSREFADPARYHVCGERYNVVKIEQPIFQLENVYGYVCELCNYVRFYEAEMKLHLDNEHEDGDTKEFKEFLFFCLPQTKRGRKRKNFHIHGESKNDFDEESESECEEEYALEGQDEKSKNNSNVPQQANEYEKNEENEWETSSSDSDSTVIFP